MHPLLWLIITVLDVYAFILFVWVIVSILIAFNVINTHNRFVAIVADFLYKVTEPALRPIRQFLPNLGGIDISPLILWIIIQFVRYTIIYYLA